MAAVIGALRADLSASAAKFEEDMGRAAAALERFGKKASRIGDRLETAGLRITAAITVPMAALGATALKTGGNYEAAMNRVQAATLASEKEMDRLHKTARALGKDLNNNADAIQAAEGMEILAKNGLSVTQMLDGALEASIRLSAATSSELAPAADVATDVMLQFGKSAKDLGPVVDGIVGTLLESKFGFDDYRLALGQAGGVAGGVGVEFTEFNAVIAATSALFAGGSDAGTSFKTFLASLPGISGPAAKAIERYGLKFFDAQGNMRSMVEITEELQTKLGGLNEKAKLDALQQIFGRDAMRTAIGLMATGADELGRLEDKIASASAQDQMDALLKGWNGMLVRLGKAFTELRIRIAESGILDLATRLGEQLTQLIIRFSELPDGVLAFGTALGAAAAIIGPLMVGLGAVMNALSGLAPLFSLVASQAGLIGPVVARVALVFARFGSLTNPVIAAIAFLISSVVKFRGIFGEAFAFIGNAVQQWLVPAFEKIQSAFANVMGAFAGAEAGPIGKFFEFLQWVVAEVTGLLLKFAGGLLVRVVSIIAGAFATLLQLVADTINVISSLLSGDFAGAFEGALSLVSNVVSGILDILDSLIPGVRNVITAVVGYFQGLLVRGIQSALAWIENRFPGLVTAMAGAARAVVNWAKWMLESVKVWLNDKFWPVIAWARNRLRELNDLWSKIRRRQADLKGEEAQTEQPLDLGEQGRGAATAPPPGAPPGAPPADPSGGGSKGASEAERMTSRLRDALEDVNDSIDKAFSRNRVPRSMQQAAELRDRLSEVEAEARAAGVNMAQFNGTLATARDRIDQMELELLAREAQDFARDVRALSRSVNDLASDTEPLQRALDDVSDRHERVRDRIVEAIEENRVLADSNADAAKSMEDLQRQLVRLDAAYAKATEAAKEMHKAQEALKDAQAAQEAAGRQADIEDALRAAGRTSGSSYGDRNQQLQRDLDQKTRAAWIELQQLQIEHMAAVAEGDTAQADRLQNQIDLQQRLHDIVAGTTVEQIRYFQNLNAALDDFESGMSDLLTESLHKWEWDWESFFQLWRDLGRDTFIKPFMEEMSGSLRNFLQGFLSKLSGGMGGGASAGGGGSMQGFMSSVAGFFKSFAGGFAEGGRIRPGQWGIVGENGIEAIQAGAAGINVHPDFQPRAPSGNVVFNVTTPNADSFNRNQRQTGRLARMTLGI